MTPPRPMCIEEFAKTNGLPKWRQSTEAAYRDAIATGDIREATNREHLRWVAMGNPRLERTWAARRVLIKRTCRSFGWDIGAAPAISA